MAETLGVGDEDDVVEFDELVEIWLVAEDVEDVEDVEVVEIVEVVGVTDGGSNGSTSEAHHGSLNMAINFTSCLSRKFLTHRITDLWGNAAINRLRKL